MDKRKYTLKPETLNDGIIKLDPVGYLELNSSVKIFLFDKLPNRFHRLMARLLLGWKYEEAK